MTLLALSSSLPLGCTGHPRAGGVEEDAPAPLADWPPRKGEPFPDHEFHDRDGRSFRMSSLAGKVVLVEPIGMSCGACNAFAGANEPGRSGFAGTRPQSDLPSIERLLPRFGNGVTLDHPDLVLVHLLLYDMKKGAPTRDGARRWAEHFEIDQPNHVVLHADESFIGPASHRMIPGFFLLDRELVVCSDSTGHRPADDLYRELLPMAGRLLPGD